jgi:eukaryotic-like serine/threonine-protein kinase
MSLDLGNPALELINPIGRGGMGEIWRAVHHPTQIEVAVKLIHDKYARDAVHREGFRQEVWAMSRMQHLGIVTVYDCGIATGEPHEGVRERPWYAMELASHASLNRVGNWSTLRRVLLEVLDALAHAHARGVIHRDLKPSNILLDMDESGILRTKLTDFGLAHTISLEFSKTQDVFAASGGTAAFMAPEQFEGRWRDYGPWTDLYALGCVAFVLATGNVVFDVSGLINQAHLHLHADPPHLEPRFDVPSGFAPWVRTLLTKDHRGRPQRAADAARALMKMDGEAESSRTLVDPTTTSPAIRPRQTGTDPAAAENLVDLESPRAVGVLESMTWEIPATDVQTGSGDKPATTVPATWRSRSEPAATMPDGLGLGLFALRESPFIDRDDLRDQIWSEITKTCRENTMRALILTGERGVGKTRLVDWIAHRAHAVGATITLKCPDGQPQQIAPLIRMLEHHFQCIGMPIEQVFSRLRFLLPDMSVRDVAGLSSLIRDDRPVPNHPIVFNTLQERRFLIARVLADISRSRAILCCVDGGENQPETLEFILELLQTSPFDDVGILFMITCIEPVENLRPRIKIALKNMAALNTVTMDRVAKISRDGLLKMIHGGLRLDENLAEKIVMGTAGNPLLAMQLLQSWVQSGGLTWSETGYTLVDTEKSTEQPRTIDDIWAGRIRQIVDSFDNPDWAMAALEIAAVMGRQVSEDRWVATCGRANVPILAGLIDELILQAVALRKEGAWEFLHRSVVEYLIENARSESRLISHHKACLRDAQESSGPMTASTIRRIDHHSQAVFGPNDSRAIQARLLLVEDVLRFEGHNNLAREYLEEIIDRLRGKDRSALRAHALLLLAKTLNHLSQFDAALNCAQEASIYQQRLDDQKSLAESWIVMGDLHLQRESGHQQARIFFERALALATEENQTRLEIQALGSLGHLCHEMSLQEDAIAYFDEIWPKLNQIDDAYVASDIYSNVALVHRQQGDTKTAENLWRSALRIQRDHGYRFLEARTLCNLAVVSQDQGRFEEASHLYREGITILREVGNLKGEAHALQNWADALTELGRFALAIELFERARQLSLRLGNKRTAAVGLTNMAVLELHRGNLDRALEICESALACHRQFQNPLFVNFTLWVVAEVNIATGQLDKANRICREAMMNFTAVSEPFTWAIFRVSEAKIKRYQARPAKAQTYLAEALRIFEDTGRTDDQGRCCCEMGFLALTDHAPLEKRLERARVCLETAENIAKQLESPPAGFLTKLYGRLSRAVHAAELGSHLLRGEDPDDLPSGLRAKLDSADSPGA